MRKRREEQRARGRVGQWLRELFSSGAPVDPAVGPPDETEGGVGFREPRRPPLPSLHGAVALDPQLDETRDVRAVGDERD